MMHCEQPNCSHCSLYITSAHNLDNGKHTQDYKLELQNLETANVPNLHGAGGNEQNTYPGETNIQC